MALCSRAGRKHQVTKHVPSQSDSGYRPSRLCTVRFAGAATVLLAAYATAKADVREELAAKARVADALAASLSISYELNDQLANGQAQHLLITAGWHGANWFQTLEQRPTTTIPGVIPGQVTGARIGGQSIAYQDASGTAILQQGVGELDMKLGWEVFPVDFGSACLRLTRLDGSPVSSRNLTAILEEEGNTLRAAAEDAAGVACFVVDVRTSDGIIVGTLWLDPSRGALPIRQEWSRGPGQEPEVFEVLDATEFTSGLWLPTRTMHVLPNGTVREIVVASDASGDLQICSGAGDPRLADLLASVPPGTEVFDAATQQFIVARVDDHQGIVANQMRLAALNRSQSHSEPTTAAGDRSRPWWSTAAFAATLMASFSACLLFAMRRPTR